MAKLCRACGGPVCPTCGGCITEGECSCGYDLNYEINADLLAACEDAYEWLGDFVANGPIVFGGEAQLGETLQTAIAKAKGEG